MRLFRPRNMLILNVTLILGLYVGAYLSLSRAGFAEADRFGIKGFYYVPYSDTDQWERRNRWCTIVFNPLNILDRWTGAGRYPAGPPCLMK